MLGNLFSFGFGVTYNGKVIETYYTGRAKMESEEKANDDTVISVGSITKIFTSCLLSYPFAFPTIVTFLN